MMTVGLLLLASVGLASAAKDLRIYFIDVEGGQSTLVVSPSGESILIDTGWAGYNGRDADRIAAAAQAAGVKKIDYLIITHYHVDHVGGVPQLAARLPIVNFVDHGPDFEATAVGDAQFKAYVEIRDKGKHILAKPGDRIPVKGLDVQVLTSAGEAIAAPLPGAGQPNPECAAFKPQAPDPGENARSLGTLLTYGKFRMLDLGDLTWNKEYDLVCPVNKIGVVDVFLVSHHGFAISNSPQLVHAIQPRVAIMNNGARKGGTNEAWQTVRDTPGLLDFWQLHYTVAGGKEHNVADDLIANPDEKCEGKWIQLTAKDDGSFTVVNGRNQYQKTYPK
jgi:competence protein ComEC